jgi:hypothetical protein
MRIRGIRQHACQSRLEAPVRNNNSIDRNSYETYEFSRLNIEFVPFGIGKHGSFAVIVRARGGKNVDQW